MKMGNIRSPFPYDPGICHSFQLAGLRLPAIWHYAAPPGEGLLYVARMGDCRRLCRARPVRDRRSAAGVPARDRRVEVDQKELRIMGSKSVLLRTLIAGSSAKTAGFGVPTSGRTRFERVTAA